MNWLARLFIGRPPAIATVFRSAVRPAAPASKPARGSRSRLVAGSAVLALAVGTVSTYEGLRTKAYLDVVDVPTVCFGETRNVKLGDVHTVAECKRMLADRLVEFEVKMRRCLLHPDAIPDKPYVAMLSLSYNIGWGAFCQSTVARKANQGDLVGACNAFSAWTKAGGKTIPGLVRRRAEERKLCLEGVQ